MITSNISVTIIEEDIYKYTESQRRYIQVIKTYREKLKSLKNVAHVDKTGIYLLLGVNDFGQNIVYVGKAVNVYERVVQHTKDEDKNFFSEVYLITSTDNTFGDSQASYLENFMYNRFRISPSIIVANDVVPFKTTMNDADTNDCEIWGDVIVGIISQSSNARLLITQFGRREETKFILKGIKKCELAMTYVKGRYIVHKDSKISRTLCSNPTSYMKSERDRFIETGQFIEYKDFMILANDIVFDSIGQATNILTGVNVSNANMRWMNYNQVTLKDYIENGNNNS